MKEFPYKIDDKLKQKLDRLIEQLDKQDAWILIDGDEGSGKSNMLTYILYYVHCKTGRDFSVDNLYFKIEELFNTAKSTENKLLGWDEAALGGLSKEWWSTAQINLLKFAMTGRKKHHFVVLCIPRFDKVVEQLRLDRTHALIHMDSGRSRKNIGHYIWVTRRGKRVLNGLWEKKRKRLYHKCAGFGGFSGYVPYIMEDVIDMRAYDRKKDEGIESIGATKTSLSKIDLKLKRENEELKQAIIDLKNYKKLTIREVAKVSKRGKTTIARWENDLIDGTGNNLSPRTDHVLITKEITENKT